VAHAARRQLNFEGAPVQRDPAGFGPRDQGAVEGEAPQA